MSDSNRTDQKKFDIFAPLRGIFHKYDDEDDEEIMEIDYDPEPAPRAGEVPNEPEDAHEDDEQPETKAAMSPSAEASPDISDETAKEPVPVKASPEKAENTVKTVKVRRNAPRSENAAKAHASAAKSPAPVQKTAPAQTIPPASEDKPLAQDSAKGKLGSLFGKLVEIITQPEEGVFPEDDDVLEDIFADNGGDDAAAENIKSAKTIPSPSSLYRGDAAHRSERLRPEKVDEDEEATFSPAADEKPEPVTAPLSEEKQADPEPAAGDASQQNSAAAKTAITIEAIMQAKKSAATGIPMTYKAVIADEAADAAQDDAVEAKAAETAEAAENAPAELTAAQDKTEKGLSQTGEKHGTKVKVHAVPKGQKPSVKPVASEDKGTAASDAVQSAKEDIQEPTEMSAPGSEIKTAENEAAKAAEEAAPAKAAEEAAPAKAEASAEPEDEKTDEAPPESATLYKAPQQEKAPVTAKKAPAAETAAVAAAVTAAAAASKAVTAAGQPSLQPRPAARPGKPAAYSAERPAAKPVQPAKPIQSTKPAQPIQPVKPVRPVQPAAQYAAAPADNEPMVYHSHDGIPFVVMAGKFSKTIRAEYEAARKYRALAAPEAQAGPASSPAQGVQSPVQKYKKQVPLKKSAAKKPSAKPEEAAAAGGAAAAVVAGAAAAVGAAQAAEGVSEAVRPARPPIKLPKKKKTLGSRISGLFSMNDEFDEDPNEQPEARPELDDYKSVDEADEIRSDINENLRKVFVRTVALTVTTVTALITALLAYFMPSLFTTIIHHGWLVYSLILLALLMVSVYFDRYPIYNGLVSLLRFKGDSETAASVAVVAVTIQTIFALFLPDVFVNGTYHIYVPLVILALLLNSVGKLLIVKRTADNFRFLCKKEARYAGKIYTDIDNAEKLVRDLPSRKPIIAYSKRSDFMSNFLRLSYAVDPVEDLSRMIAPFTACFSLLCGIAYGAVTKDFVGGVSSFALTSVITIPMCTLLAINIPMKNLSGSTLSKGAMLTGYESVKQFADTNTVLLDFTDLYPKGSIILSGIKAFSETKIQDAILAGAAVTFAVNGSMTYIFETMIQDRQNMLPKVESVTYDDNMGLSGWIGGQRILIGNRDLLKKHNITPPNERLERKYRKMGNEIAYISVGGELVAMFIMTYKADRRIAEALRELEDNGVSFVVRTIDPNITAKHIAEKFSLYSRCVTVLRTGMGTIAYDEISGKEKTSRAYLVTNGKIEAFASAVSGCIKMRSTVTISKIIQMLSISIGFVLVNILSFFSGFAKLGVFELLLYIGFWCIALIAVSVAARKIS